MADVFWWSKAIHGDGPRHTWAIATARAILDGRELPPPPGRWMPGAAERRVETIRELLARKGAAR